MSFQHPDPPVSDEPALHLTEPTLADTDDDQEDRGRIGYGKNERTSSWMLGGVLVLMIVLRTTSGDTRKMPEPN